MDGLLLSARTAGLERRTGQKIGRAMLEVAKHGSAKRVLESPDIEAAAQAVAS